jgi:adenylyltransferase/sulfurtransferase
VQLRLSAAGDGGMFDRVEARLAPAAHNLTRNPYLLRCEIEGVRLSLFVDGRLLVHGTNDIARARTIAARYFG